MNVSAAPGDELFRAVMTNSAIGTALVTPDGAFLAANAALCAMLGRTEHDLTACTWQQLTHADDVANDIALQSEVLGGHREAYRLNNRYLRPDGEVVYGDLSVSCIRGPDGEVEYLVKQIVDVTDATVALDRYRLLAENVTDVVVLGDNAGVIQWVSSSVSEILGWAPEQIVGRPFQELLHEEDRGKIAAVQADLLAGRWGSGEVRLRRADGSFAWMDIRLKPLVDAVGAVVGRVASWRLAATKVERERFRAALDAEIDAHVFLDAIRDADGEIVDLLYVDANGAAADYVQLPLSELLGSRMLERFPGQRPAGLFAKYLDTIETGRQLELDSFEIVSEISGGARFIAFRGVKVGDGLSLTWRDVTDAITAARALAESEARYRLLAENASDVVFEADTERIVQWVSPSAREVLGLDQHDVIGVPVGALFHPDDLVRLASSSAQVDAEERTSQRARYRRADGTLRWAEVATRPIWAPDGQIVARVGSLRDVDEQVLAELALAAAEERYRNIAENVTDVVIRARPDGIIEWVFGSTVELIGRTPEELIGMDVRELVADIDRDEMEERVASVLAGQVLVGTIRLRRADGGTNWVSRRTRAILADDGTVDYVLMAWSDAQVEMEYREALAASERQAVDLARRFEAARDEAVQATDAKNSFLSLMSHELRTPLNSVLGFAQLLAMDPLTPDQRDAVQLIRAGGTHLLHLINEILDISRVETGRLSLSMESVDVADAVAEALDLVRPVADEAGISLAVHDDADTGLSVWADRQRVIQVLLNLLTNAVKYNRVGGTYSLGCSKTADGMVSISVSDTGIGISEPDLARLFRPFERLGAEATTVEGTGIGLTLSEALARVMGGRIDVSSTPGEGSMFSLVLPSAVSAVSDAAPVPAMSVRAGRSVRVLYIEDNPANQHLMERIAALRDGVTLTLASNGHTGLQMALEDPPDLVLLDLHLPDLSGDGVLLQLRADERTADVPILVVTADASVEVRQRLESLGSDGFLTKPVEISDVLAWFDNPRRMRH